MNRFVRRTCVVSALFCLGLGALPSIGSAAEPLKVIALQYRLFDDSGRQRGDVIAVGDPARVWVGETVRLELVGSAIIGNVGREIPIDARFEVAAGKGAIEIVRSGRSWVDVAVRGESGNGLAQVGFTVTGNYEMRGKNTFGRLTLDIARDTRPGTGNDNSWGGGSNASIRDLAETLYKSILHMPFTGRDARLDFERIRAYGQEGALDVAVNLAREADRQGFGRSVRERGYQDDDVRRAGELYRALLKRPQSDQELWNQDRGFVDNVRALHEHGLVALVESIVGSAEFRQAWGLAR